MRLSSLSLLSSTGTEQLAAANTNFSIPSWILWGVGVAALLTFGLLLFASAIALLFTGITGGWQGGAEPWKEIGNTAKAFIMMGLPVGMVASYAWFHVNPPWLAVFIGAMVFCLIWGIMTLIEKRKRRSRY